MRLYKDFKTLKFYPKYLVVGSLRKNIGSSYLVLGISTTDTINEISRTWHF